MVARFEAIENRLIDDIWGRSCIECNSLMKPRFHLYQIKNEEVAVLTCPACDFTIVVVELEKLPEKKDEKLPEKKDRQLMVSQTPL